MAPAVLSLSGLVKRYGAIPALDGVSLDIAAGEFLTILGPSGSGKTTLLKAIAGFEPLDAGRIVIDGADMTALPPARRDIGMVFQNYALFPHMSVADNIGFPLRMRGVARAEIARRVTDALALVELPGSEARYPAQLSGGQQQRVALARAVIFDPRLLLLDEPFGALDRKLREAMQLEVRRLQRRLGLTTIFITHDQEEALLMSDRVAVMRAGKILQIGAPRALYAQPEDGFTADFLGESTVFPGRVVAVAGGIATVETTDGLRLLARAFDAATPGARVAIVVRPEVPQRVVGDRPYDNRLGATVTEAIYLGSAVKYRLLLAQGGELLVRWPARPQEPPLALGAALEIGWAAADAHLLRDG